MRLYGFVSFFLIISAIIVGVLFYGFVSWQKSGNFFGFSPYKEVELVDLLSFGNLYDGKKVCSTGFYVKTPDLEILKVSMEEDRFTKSPLVYKQTRKENKGFQRLFSSLFSSPKVSNFSTVNW